jgi:uncharacterized protein YdeI (YjbR/CyaY-like superfamily)
MARTLDARISILTLLTHPSYTLCRLRAHPLGAPHIATFEALRDQGMQVLTQEILLTDALIEAQARVSAADDRLNDGASLVSKTVLTITRDDTSHPLYHLFFGKKSLSEFKRPILNGQYDAMRAWPESLRESTHAALEALAPEIQAGLVEAQEAMAARSTARQQLRHFRDAGARRQWVDQLNGGRKEAHGALAKLPHRHTGLAMSFADQFFLMPPREEEEAEETPDALRAELAELQRQGAAIEERLAELEAAEVDAKKAAEARAAQEAALVEMDQAMAELTKKRAALRAQLEAAPA